MAVCWFTNLHFCQQCHNNTAYATVNYLFCIQPGRVETVFVTPHSTAADVTLAAHCINQLIYRQHISNNRSLLLQFPQNLVLTFNNLILILTNDVEQPEVFSFHFYSVQLLLLSVFLSYSKVTSSLRKEGISMMEFMQLYCVFYCSKLLDNICLMV